MKEKNNISSFRKSFKLLVRKGLFILIIQVFVGLLPVNTLALTGEYDVKAVSLSKIAKYIEWPEKADMVDESKPFVIAVFGRNPFGTILDHIYVSGKKKIKNKNVVIHYLTEVGQIDQCHILFISGSEEKRLDKILSRTKGKAILTFGDTKNFGEKGVHFNFYKTKDTIKFELNESSVAVEGIVVDYRLRNFSKIVGSGRGGER